jgi:hypothetical protein
MSRQGWHIIAVIIAALVLACALGAFRAAEPPTPSGPREETGGPLHATR